MCACMQVPRMSEMSDCPPLNALGTPLVVNTRQPDYVCCHARGKYYKCVHKCAIFVNHEQLFKTNMDLLDFATAIDNLCSTNFKELH